MPDNEPQGKTPVRSSWLGFLKSKWHWRLKPAALARYQTTAQILLLLGLSLAITLLFVPHPRKPLSHYQVGAISQENVRAFKDFLVEDVETTRQRQQELLAKIPPVFDLDEEAAAKVQESLHRGLEYLRKVIRELPAPMSPPEGRGASPSWVGRYQELLKHKAEFERLLGVKIPAATFQLLVKTEISPALETLTYQVISQIYRQGVVNPRTLAQPQPREILLRRLPSLEEQVIQAPFPFLVVDELRKPVNLYCREVAAEFSAADRLLVCDLVQHLVQPNISANLAETQARRQKALEQLRPTYFQVKKGELILREGERITPLHLAKLKAQNEAYPRHGSLLAFLGGFLSLVLILWLAYNLARISLKNFSTQLKDLFFLAVLIFVSLLLNQSLLNLAALLTPVRPELGRNLVYALPIALGPICAALFLGLETGLALTFLIATFTALLLEKPFPLFLYLFCGSLMGVWGVSRFSRRGSLINSGLAICGVNLIMVTAFKFLDFPFTSRDLLMGELCALGGGLLTGILALGFTPIIESLFRYTSNIRLLELLNLDQPLLKELMLVAPGTYHHSLVVGQMVEAAAAAIGANPLLAKAAAYYHDIGKIKKPAYFVENQYGGENKHEKLAPSMSSLILISHVKDGVELARKHHLGSRICDIIQQHHGTCTISYFYNKAKSLCPDPNKVNPDDYRYPGPKPQTKEAGLVLVADQVEAASKTLTDPTPARIQGMVQKIVNNIFADGQLDECELTLKELHLIAKHCNKILSGIFHQRIQYPVPVEKTRSHEDLDKQPTKKNGLKPVGAPRKNHTDLKRLGMG
jgi:putative nucleotidyltransferase with HDIG domain